MNSEIIIKIEKSVIVDYSAVLRGLTYFFCLDILVDLVIGGYYTDALLVNFNSHNTEEDVMVHKFVNFLTTSKVNSALFSVVLAVMAIQPPNF